MLWIWIPTLDSRNPRIHWVRYRISKLDGIPINRISKQFAGLRFEFWGFFPLNATIERPLYNCTLHHLQVLWMPRWNIHLQGWEIQYASWVNRNGASQWYQGGAFGETQTVVQSKIKNKLRPTLVKFGSTLLNPWNWHNTSN
ncbi:MAG: hypothetical protein Ct9H90mP16_14370 [Candidatus Poseidoniales archaeon]|nr:MAG: hypothetical protein Ct9H90mP16_14370 [Candidatus Poseidoniales archaeon]